MTSLFGEIHNSIFVGPIKIKKDFERNNIHSNEMMKSIKKASKPVTTNAQKRLDREEAMKRKNGNKRVKYMYNIQL